MIEFIVTSFNRRRVEWISVVASLLLSLWLIYSDSVINNDGILYIRTAELIISGQWQAAFDTYRWPFFPYLIGTLHGLVGMDLVAAAHCINTAFYALLVWVYIALLRMMGASERVLWFAALFILILPSLNSYRSFVIRDAGFWAFYMAAIFCLCRFLQDQRWRYALGWGSAMIVATLFRIEGIAFMVLLPCVVIWVCRHRPAAAFARYAQLNVIGLASVALAAVWLVYGGHEYFVGRLHEPVRWLNYMVEGLFNHLQLRADALRVHVLNEYSESFALSGLIMFLLFILLSYIAQSIGLLGALAVAVGWKDQAFAIPAAFRAVLNWLIAINLIVLSVFVSQTFFLTGRFVVALTLAVAVYVPFGLDALYTRLRSKGASRWTGRIAVLIAAVMAVDSLWSFGVSKDYLKGAGEWLHENVKPDTRIYTDSDIVAFYAGRFERRQGDTPRFAEQPDADLLATYDYLAIVVKRDEEVPGALVAAQPVRVFSNERNDRVLIFRTASPER